MEPIHASFRRRLAALYLDWVASWAVISLVTHRWLGIGNWILLMFFCEVALLTALTGQSAGQRICHIRVVSWPEYSPLSPLAAVMRTLLLCLVIPPLITDKDGRGLHDRIMRSIVVKA